MTDDRTFRGRSQNPTIAATLETVPTIGFCAADTKPKDRFSTLTDPYSGMWQREQGSTPVTFLVRFVPATSRSTILVDVDDRTHCSERFWMDATGRLLDAGWNVNRSDTHELEVWGDGVDEWQRTNREFRDQIAASINLVSDDRGVGLNSVRVLFDNPILLDWVYAITDGTTTLPPRPEGH